jgi:type VI secretion system secreted protein VgrG
VPTAKYGQVAPEAESKELFALPGRLSFTLDLRFGGGRDQGQRELDVLSFAGEEAIASLYSFDVELAERAERRSGLDWAQVLGQPGTLTILTGKTTSALQPVVRHGIVARVAALDPDDRRRRYRVRLVPQVWRLAQNRNCRIFQNRTTAQIVEQLLREGGVSAFAFDASKRAKRKPREYCVQYQESDWGFIKRLLEEEGWATSSCSGRRSRRAGWRSAR